MGQVSSHSWYSKKHSEECCIETHGSVHKPGEEVNVGIQLPGHEIVICTCRFKKLEGHINQGVPPCHLEHLNHIPELQAASLWFDVLSVPLSECVGQCRAFEGQEAYAK